MTAISSKYIRTRSGYLMVLRHRDDVLAALTTLTERESIPSASFVGMGFAGVVTFGFYDFARKAYDPKTFLNVELASMTGTIAWQKGKPSLHAHGVITGADFTAHGGHLLALEVGTGSMELTITTHEQKLEREIEPTIGANILSLPPR